MGCLSQGCSPTPRGRADAIELTSSTSQSTLDSLEDDTWDTHAQYSDFSGSSQHSDDAANKRLSSLALDMEILSAAPLSYDPVEQLLPSHNSPLYADYIFDDASCFGIGEADEGGLLLNTAISPLVHSSETANTKDACLPRSRKDKAHETWQADDSRPPGTRSKRDRERNRTAAAKCRRKAKNSVSQLQTREREVVDHNRTLKAQSASLREEVLVLRHQILAHSSCNSETIRKYILRSAQNAINSPVRN